MAARRGTRLPWRILIDSVSGEIAAARPGPRQHRGYATDGSSNACRHV